VLAEIANAMVGLYKRYFGKGPTRVRAHYQGDVVTCVLRDGFTRADQTLIEAGRHETVIQQRHQLQLAVRDEFTSAIERITGRKVIGFFSGSQPEPAIEVEVFVLAPPERDGSA
jgi:uncharacterized protein YbcI